MTNWKNNVTVVDSSQLFVIVTCKISDMTNWKNNVTVVDSSQRVCYCYL